MSNVVLADLQTTPNTDTLASGPTCTSLTGPAGACSGNVVTLAPGQVANYTATLITNQNDLNAGSIADSATATGKTPASVTIPSNTALNTVAVTQTASLTISKSVSPATASTASQVETSSFTVTNNGNVTLTNVGVADVQTGGTGTLPATPTCQSVSVSPFTCSGTTVTLAPNEIAVFATTYTVTQADINNDTTITDSAKASGTTPGNVTFSTTAATGSFTIAQTTGLTTTKNASPTTISSAGTLITYSFTVTNNGDVTMSNVVLADLQTTPNTDTLGEWTHLHQPHWPGGCAARATWSRSRPVKLPTTPPRWLLTKTTSTRINRGLRHRHGQDPGQRDDHVQHGAQHRRGHPDGVAHDQQVRLAGDGLDGVTG